MSGDQYGSSHLGHHHRSQSIITTKFCNELANVLIAGAAAPADTVVIGGKQRKCQKVLLAPLPACLVSNALDVKSGARLKATPDECTTIRIGRSSGMSTVVPQYLSFCWARMAHRA